MKVVIQRVLRASVSIGGDVHSEIGRGLMVLLGVDVNDTEVDAEWLAAKTTALRIFDDADGVMNLSVCDVQGEVLVVSQFTLLASTRRGNRPSYIAAAGESVAVPLYHKFTQLVAQAVGRPVLTGVFGADMQVELINDGPVTICIDSHNRV